MEFTEATIPKETSLNSRLLYNDSFFNQLVQTTTAYETTSGTIAQQEFTYLEVNPDKVFILGMITTAMEFRNYRNLKSHHFLIKQSMFGYFYRIRFS